MHGMILVFVMMLWPGPLTFDGEFVCPPCGCELDQKHFKKPGACGDCGMALIKKSEADRRNVEVPRKPPARNDRPNVGILIFEGVQIIDFTGPFEVFGQAHYNVFTVWQHKQELTTAMGMKVRANYSFEDHPELEVLVVPGGNIQPALNSEAAQDWVKEKAGSAKHVLTVCNGAFILAKTGHLDGKQATTYYGLIDSLKAFAPEVEVISDRRFVDNGKIVTTAGLSSGIEGSLYIIEKMMGRVLARSSALNMEYNWVPGNNYARADFADRVLVGGFLSGRNYPRIELPQSEWELLETDGDRDQWSWKWSVKWSGSSQELAGVFGEALVKYDHWRALPAQSEEMRFSYSPANGRNFTGIVKVSPGQQGFQMVHFAIKSKGRGNAAAGGG